MAEEQQQGGSAWVPDDFVPEGAPVPPAKKNASQKTVTPSPSTALAKAPISGKFVGEWKPKDFQPETPTTTSPPATISQDDGWLDTAADVAKGAGKGALSTLTGIGRLAVPDWLVGKERAQRARETEQSDLMTPTTKAQKVGFGGEQAAEFLIPGAGEEKIGALAAEHLPMLGRAAAPVARIGYNALTSGALNKLQGGSFESGALLGGAGGAVGEAGRAVAPSLAESALGITKRYRGFGRTPGTAALEEVRGIAPGKIAQNAEAKLADLTSQLETAAKASNKPASTAPAIGVVHQEMAKAIRQNSRAYYDQLQGVLDQLTKDFSSGASIPSSVPASQLLDLKRGIGKLEKTWNPETKGIMQGAVRKVYSALDGELDRAVPGSAELNQRISSLIPVAQRAKSTEAGAALGQRVAHRVAAHTGALAGAGMGGALGYERGGTQGAVMGGLAGLVIPELLASAPAQMVGARMARAPGTYRLGRGLAAQLLDRNSENNP